MKNRLPKHSAFPSKAPGTIVDIPISFFDHPIIGLQAEPPKPLDPNHPAYAPSVAWLRLVGANFTRMEVTDHTGVAPAAVKLCLSAPAPAVPDCSTIWNWRKNAVERFADTLAASGLIDDHLVAAIKQAIRTDRRRSFSPPTRLAVFSRTKGKCAYCGTALVLRSGHTNSLHLDHLFPISKGGEDHPDMCVPACAQCNQAKGGMSIVEFIQKLRSK